MKRFIAGLDDGGFDWLFTNVAIKEGFFGVSHQRSERFEKERVSESESAEEQAVLPFQSTKETK